jgi:putative MATE family efflux protein
MTLVMGVVLSILGVIVSPFLLQFMKTPESVMPEATAYLRIYFAGVMGLMIYNMGSGILRAVGDSQRPFYFLMCSALLNIVLDLVFVLGLGMGVEGVALATVIAQAVSAVLVIVTLLKTPTAIHLFPRAIRFTGTILKSIIIIGLPAGLQSVMYSFSNIIIQTSVNGFGTDVMAAWTAYGKIDGLFWMVISAFGVAITTFAGQNFGARHYERMKKSVRVCLGMAAIATVCMSSFILLFGRPMLSLFTDDAHVLETGVSVIRLIVPLWISYICIEVLSGAMRGAGDTLVPTLMTLVGVCLIRVFWVTMIVPAHHELRVLLLSYPLTWSVTSVLFILYYRKGKWLDRCIKRQTA